jgi:chorismate-pyruvate lyase
LLSSRAAILSLHRKLLASASATAVLREVFGDPVEIARADGPAEAASNAQCAALGVAGPDEVVHRRVVLMAAGRAVSDADLWYVPARLWPGMAATLLTSTTPFGTVVAPMQPRRESIAARICTPGEAYALHHEALLHVGEQRIALVHEFYRRK